MKTLTILALFISASFVQADTLDPRWLAGETIRQSTADHRITRIRYLRWGLPGTSDPATNKADSVIGAFCPPGKIWLIKSSGLITTDGAALPWMLQIAIENPFGSGGVWLVPLHRQNGYADATPVLATDRDIILEAGEALAGRSCGVGVGKQAGLMYSGWEFDECYLPQLIGFRGSESSNPALDSYNAEIRGLEKSLQTLKGN